MTKERITTEDVIKMGVVPIKMGVDGKMGGTEEVVFAISKDKKYIKNIEKLLWKNRSDPPFADLHTSYLPNPNPGYKGSYILVVTNPSPEIVSSITPSRSGEGKYSHLEEYDMKELSNKIHDMFVKGNDIWTIAQEFNVDPRDIESWMHYTAFLNKFMGK